MKGVLVDLGGVLVPSYWRDAGKTWAARLGISQCVFMTALFGLSDETVLVGRVTESAWWDVIRKRLNIDPDVVAELRRDLAARETWDEQLVAALRRIRGVARTGIVSNAWSDTRARITAAGLDDVVDELVLSCEVGFAKPDPRIFIVALDRLGVEPRDVLFIDDNREHLETAWSLGMQYWRHRDVTSTIAAIRRFVRNGRRVLDDGTR